MRSSRVLRVLRAGGVVSCFGCNLGSSRIAQIAAMHGYDCLWLKNEHTASDWSVIEHQINAAKIHDVDSMVRVSRGSYSDYIKPLELDAAGIMVPHVMSVGDAQEVIHYTRFHPLGRRPIDGGNADGDFTRIPVEQYIAEANRERFIVLQIEDWEAMNHLDEICSLDGFDVLFLGIMDYSHSLGSPGRVNDPEMLEVRAKIAEAARNHGKVAGVPSNPSVIDRDLEMGYRFFILGGDVSATNTYCSSMMQEFGKRRTAGTNEGEQNA